MSIGAYFGDESLKALCVDRAERHRLADEIAQNHGYWRRDRDGRYKGCAIGCVAEVNRYAHEEIERIANLPRVLSRIADVIFEGLPTNDAVRGVEHAVLGVDACGGADGGACVGLGGDWDRGREGRGRVRGACGQTRKLLASA